MCILRSLCSGHTVLKNKITYTPNWIISFGLGILHQGFHLQIAEFDAIRLEGIKPATF